MNISPDTVRSMDEHLTAIKLKLKCRIIDELTNCSQNFTTVNIKNITTKLQSKFNVDLSTKYWQTYIAKTMAEQLTMLSFVQSKDEVDNKSNSTEIESETNSNGTAAESDNNTDLWIQIQRDIEEQEREMNDNEIDTFSSSTKKGNIEFDSIAVRWKSHNHFKVEPGIETTQITKTGGAYSSIYTLEPMIARKFEFTFLLGNVRERGKPWIGIGIISSKCPLLRRNKQIGWHGASRYSVGWYYGTQIWQDHAPYKGSYGNGSYWQSGDEITMIVDAKNYTLRYKLNEKDMGVAVSDFNKLLDSGINERYYVIISIQQTMNSVTLMNSYRYRDSKRFEPLNESPAADDKLKSFFKSAFGGKKSKARHEDMNSEVVREDNEEKLENSHDDEFDLLRNKLKLQTKSSANLKVKYEAVLRKYENLEKIKNRNESELKRMKREMIEIKKELDLSRGAMHELESNLLSSLQVCLCVLF